MNILTKRLRLAAVATAVAATIGLVGCSTGGDTSGSTDGSSQSLQKINFGYIGDFNGTSLLAIAEDQGLWKKEGLEVSTKSFTAGPLEVTAMGAGSLDFGYIGPGALWLPAQGKAKIIAVNTFTNADRVVALPGKGITSLADLKGKTVGYPAGTSGEMILRLALAKVNLTMKDIKAEPLDPATLVSALTSGKVDAAGFNYPSLAAVKTKYPDMIELAKDSDFKAEMRFPTAFVAQEDLPTKDPALVTKVLTVIKEANTYRYEHKSEAVALTATMLGLDKAAVTADAGYDQLVSTPDLEKAATDGSTDQWFDTFGAYFTKTGVLTSPGKASDYFTSDLYAKAGK